VNHAAIGPIAIHFPEHLETNQALQAQNPSWNMDLIYAKTGIAQRFIAAPGETASDLGVAAAKKLFAEQKIDPTSIDFLLFCTQTPDYPLPTTACLMQDRLGLPTTCGALDFNLGCSGFVYGLSLADGLIRTGAVKRILLITAETYSKYIHPTDRSLRTIFSDAAAATLIEGGDTPSLSAYQFGTDGRGADTLIVNQGGARDAEAAIQPRHRHRWPSPLYMDGPALIEFAVDSIPGLVKDVLEAANLTPEEIDYYIFHQATDKMLLLLREALHVGERELPIILRDCGNTVSSTIPIAIDEMRRDGALEPGMKNLLVGFGVGWSWAGCIWRETWRPR
jgi:3-oxoacyl-[acyl-carrier-protein] synthase III